MTQKEKLNTIHVIDYRESASVENVLVRICAILYY